ncbi:hypothetical protein ACEQ8H_003972 [Pleosporales sp. CAS-2024a]
MAFSTFLMKMRRVLLCCNEPKQLDIGEPTDVRKVDISESLPGLTDAQRKYIREKASSDAIHLLSLQSHPHTSPPSRTTSLTSCASPRLSSSHEPSEPLLNAASQHLPTALPTPPRRMHHESSPPATRMKSMRYASPSLPPTPPRRTRSASASPPPPPSLSTPAPAAAAPASAPAPAPRRRLSFSTPSTPTSTCSTSTTTTNHSPLLQHKTIHPPPAKIPPLHDNTLRTLLDLHRLDKNPVGGAVDTPRTRSLSHGFEPRDDGVVGARAVGTGGGAKQRAVAHMGEEGESSASASDESGSCSDDSEEDGVGVGERSRLVKI